MKASLRVLMAPDYRGDNPYQALLSDALAQQGVTVEFPQGYRRGLPLWRALQGGKVPFDILHLHWLDPYLKGETAAVKALYCLKFLLDVLLVRWQGAALVWTIHNEIPHEARFPRLERWTRQALVRLAPALVVHLPSHRDWLARQYGSAADKAAVIPHGHYRLVYPAAVPQAEARAALELPQTGLIYLNLGMLRPYKGIEPLLSAWEQVPAERADATLLIAGKAQDPAYGQQLVDCAAGMAGVQLREGFIPSERIHLYYSAADVVVLPLQRILISGSLILAMSYGKPIIAPRLPAATETLGSADWLLYHPDDGNGLYRVLAQSQQVDLEALSQLVIQACDRLDWSSIGRQTYQLYCQCCHGAAR